MFANSANTFGVPSNEDGMSADPDITVTGEDAEEVEIEVGRQPSYDGI